MKERVFALTILLAFCLLASSIPVDSQFGGGGGFNPLPMFGMVFDTDGVTPLEGANVSITNLNTGDVVWAHINRELYIYDLNNMPGGATDGDVLLIEAEYLPLYGENTTVVNTTLMPPCDIYMKSGPVISHDAIELVSEGDTVNFTAMVDADTIVLGAAVNITADGTTTTYGMVQDDKNWSVHISISSSMWPSFTYHVDANDGRHSAFTEEKTVWVRDINPPTIDYVPMPLDEGTGLFVTGLSDDHGLVGANVTYFDGVVEWNMTDGGATIPGDFIQLSNTLFTVNAWDGNNTVHWNYSVEVLDATPPEVITNFTATAIPGTLNITLTWDNAIDNNVVDHYELGKSLDGSIWNWKINLTDNEYVDSEGEPTSQYFYRIRAVDRRPNLGPLTYANATTSTANPPNITHVPVSEWDEGVNLTINATITDETSVLFAYISYDTVSASAENAVMTDTGDGENFTFEFSGITVEVGRFTYRIKATDGTDWRQTKLYEVTVLDMTSPSAIDLHAAIEEVAGEEMELPVLSWSSGIDNVAVEDYVWVAQTSAFSGDPVAPFNVTSNISMVYYDAQPDTHYYFAVAARDNEGNVGPWAYNDTVVPALDTTGPSINMSTPTSAMENENLVLTATISDPAGVADVWVTYWNENRSNTILHMSNTGGDNWAGAIPYSHVKGTELRFFISATDTNNVLSTNGSGSDYHTIVLHSRVVNITFPAEVRMNLTAGENMSIDIDFSTSDEATWYFLFTLHNASYNGSIGTQNLKLVVPSVVTLGAGNHTLSVTALFPSNHTGTMMGALYASQSDADNEANMNVVLVDDSLTLPSLGDDTSGPNDNETDTSDTSGISDYNIIIIEILVIIALVVVAIVIIKISKGKDQEE